MASERNDKDGISRRDFTSRIGAATAGLVVGGEFFRPSANAAPHVGGRVLGANDQGVVTASIGIRGQGNSLKRGFAQLKNVEIKTLCDIDANLAPERINDARLKDVPTFKPKFEQDLRRVLEDKDIDAVVIATPEPVARARHGLGLQAGKHVYVEKPASYTVWEGRKMVEAAARYNKIVQVGTMNRSRPAVRDAIKFIHDGGIGKVYMARGLCFKPRPSIGKYPDGPMARRREIRAERHGVARTTSRPTMPTYLSKVDYDLWLGPAPKRPFNRNRFHYNWHWHWEYGNGDTGNQGPHQFDIARWGLNKQEHPIKVSSVGGYFGDPSSQETPNVHTSLFEYADGTILEFATRGDHTNDEGTQRHRQSVLRHEGMGLGRRRRPALAVVHPVGEKNEKGKGSGAPRAAAAAIRWFSPASNSPTIRISWMRFEPTIRSC